jgi:hypothetical protein
MLQILLDQSRAEDINVVIFRENARVQYACDEKIQGPGEIEENLVVPVC